MALDGNGPTSESYPLKMKHDLEGFIQRHFACLFETACAVTKNEIDAEDVLQNAFESAFLFIRKNPGEQPKDIYEWFNKLIIISAQELQQKEDEQEDCQELMAPSAIENRLSSPYTPQNPLFFLQLGKVSQAIEAMDEKTRAAIIDVIEGEPYSIVNKFVHQAQQQLIGVLDDAGFSGLPKNQLRMLSLAKTEMLLGKKEAA